MGGPDASGLEAMDPTPKQSVARLTNVNLEPLTWAVSLADVMDELRSVGGIVQSVDKGVRAGVARDARERLAGTCERWATVSSRVRTRMQGPLIE